MTSLRMTPLSLEAVLRRDRLIVGGALGIIVILSWLYIISLALQMSPSGPRPGNPHLDSLQMTGMTMSGMDMSGMAMAGMDMLATPHLADLPVLFLMWSVMMIGMMTPSATPMILLYARVARMSAAHGRAFAPTGWFAAGYLLSWIGFSLVATLLQGWLQRIALLTPDMVSTNRVFTGFVLVAAGFFQWGPLKEACLTQCRAPVDFIQRHGGFRPDPRGALKLGLAHGAYCVGCCWALMALLFVGGVMNMLWIAGLTALVLLEKLAPYGRQTARFIGILLMLAGAWVLLTPS